MKIFKADEEAVSPVIGVILMVAIVVILAAVIAAFVFGMAGSAGAAKSVAVTVAMTPTGTGGTFIPEATWQGGADLNKVNSWEFSDDGGTSYAAGAPVQPVVGDVSTLGTGTTLPARVIIRATFTDGSTQIIFDRSY